MGKFHGGIQMDKPVGRAKSWESLLKLGNPVRSGRLISTSHPRGIRSHSYTHTTCLYGNFAQI